MTTPTQRAADHHLVMDAVRPKLKPVRVHRKRVKQVSERKRWERRLDDIVREIVKERDGFCVIRVSKEVFSDDGEMLIPASHTDVMQCGHLITRAKKSVRWDLVNCSVQCSSCNIKHEFYPEIYTSWFLDRFGQDEYKRLCRDADSVNKLTIAELETLHFELTEIRKLQQLKAERGEPFSPRYSQKDILNGDWKK